jgi:hypothetical protein
MSDTILSGDFTVYYNAENRQKRIVWSGTTGTYSVQQLYSAIQDLFDESAQMDDGIPLSAQTPTDYTIGTIDAGDVDPWYIDPVTIQHLSGGSLQSDGWARVATSNTGIVRVPISGGTIVAGDVGVDITHTTAGDAGTLLYVGSSYLIIRPDSNAAANNFDSTSGSLSCNGHSTTQTAAATSGETIWSNIYTLGTLQANTSIYVYQNGALLSKWWSDGHIDVLIPTTNFGSLIDSGNLTIFARQYTTLYDHYVVTVASGGRTPIPIATFADTNNVTGAFAFDFDAGTGAFEVGEVVASGSKRGVITAVTQTNPTGRIEYYLIDPYSQFVNNDAITGADSAATANVNEPTAIENLVAGYTDVTYTFGSITRDLNNGQGLQPYDVEIDCNNRPLLEVYEYTKFVTRSDSTTSLNSVNGQAYIAANGSYNPVKVAPFGTFAGGKFFGARGVWLKNVPAADGNNYELIDANGVRRVPPTTIAITVNGVENDDRVNVFRTTGSNEIIDRYMYYSHATNNGLGDGTFEVTTPIDADTPASGWLRVVNDDLNNEDIYQYQSWSGSTFTLSSGVTLLDSYTSTDHAYVPYIQETAASDTVSQAVTYVINRYVLVVVRRAGSIPFKVTGQVTTSGLSVTAVRTSDSIYKP